MSTLIEKLLDHFAVYVFKNDLTCVSYTFLSTSPECFLFLVMEGIMSWSSAVCLTSFKHRVLAPPAGQQARCSSTPESCVNVELVLDVLMLEQTEPLIC